MLTVSLLKREHLREVLNIVEASGHKFVIYFQVLEVRKAKVSGKKPPRGNGRRLSMAAFIVIYPRRKQLKQRAWCSFSVGCARCRNF